ACGGCAGRRVRRWCSVLQRAAPRVRPGNGPGIRDPVGSWRSSLSGAWSEREFDGALWRGDAQLDQFLARPRQLAGEYIDDGAAALAALAGAANAAPATETWLQTGFFGGIKQ